MKKNSFGFLVIMSILVFAAIFTGCKKQRTPVEPATPANTMTATAVYTVTATGTVVDTAVPTSSVTRTSTAVITFTYTVTKTYTPTATPTRTSTRTATPTRTITFTSTITATFTISPTFTPAPTCVFVLGNPNTGSASGSASYSFVFADPYTPATTVSINSITVGLSNATNYWAAIYSDNGSNYPGTMIVETGAQNAPAAGMYTTFITPQTLTAGTQYWLLVKPQSANASYDTDAGYGHEYYIYTYAAIIAGTPPPGGSSWGYESGRRMRVSVSYCSY